MKKILEIKELTKYYGKSLGVKNVNLTLYEGEIFGFIGPNGAGKSTTIRSIMNLINKTSGEVYYKGQLFSKDRIDIYKEIGYLPSEVSLYDDLTVKKMLDYHESFYKENIHDRRKKLVSMFKLDESKMIEDLSLGNLKKLGIVIAFMHHPKLVILDEPTNGLDPIMQNVFYTLLREEAKNGTTIFYSTHVLNEISSLCDRVGIIKDGKLIKIETIQNIIKNSLTYVTIKSKDISKIEKDLNFDIVQKGNNIIKFKNTYKANELLAKLINYDIEDLLIEEATLEDIFMHYYV